MSCVKQAQEVAKKMHRTMPEWKLKDCMKQLCVDPPKILGSARASSVYSRMCMRQLLCLAGIEGGVIEVSRSSGPGTSSATPAQGP